MNDRGSWKRKQLAPYYRQKGIDLALELGLPKMGKAHVVYHMTYGNNRRLDPANYMSTVKAVIDGMVDYGWLPDDSSQFLVGPDPRRDESLPVGVTLTISQLA